MWMKIGLIFAPGLADWMRTHAQNPLPEALGDGRFRVHFAARDERNRARGGWFEFDVSDPFQTLAVSEHPTLDLGELGAFDDAGVMPSALVKAEGGRRMDYTGWARAVDVPFSFHIGLAVSDDGGRSYAGSRKPRCLAGITTIPSSRAPRASWWITVCTSLVHLGHAVGMHSRDCEPKHYYTVKYAESDDGIAWRTSDHLCIPVHGMNDTRDCQACRVQGRRIDTGCG